jgi:hypothetical protein
MDKFGVSILEAMKKRVVSTTLVTYTSFWILMHGQGVYTTFFVSQDMIYQKYRLLKSEYVYQHFFGYHGTIHVPLLFGRHIGLDTHFVWGVTPRYY